MDTIWLSGAKDVSRAASTMSSAASQMQSAASNFAHALEMHQRFMDDWLQRAEALLAAQSPSGDE